MRRIFVVFFFFVWYLNSSIITNRANYTSGFGIRISLQADGEILSFIGYQVSTNKRMIKRNLSRVQFLKYASGYWPSQFNPSRINHFKLNTIECGCSKDSLFNTEYIYCDALDSLWKIRYSRYPYHGITDEGWSQNTFRPSDKQLKFLIDKYKIKNIDSEYIFDDNLWQLLKDVKDEKWIMNYKSIW